MGNCQLEVKGVAVGELWIAIAVAPPRRRMIRDKCYDDAED